MRKGAKTKLARHFRKTMSPPEVKLWVHLRRHTREGFAIRRQHPYDRYVLDFYCDRVKLAIEVDGELHYHGERPERDEERDRWLFGEGVETMRVSAADIMADAGTVADGIMAVIRERMAAMPER